MSDEISKQVGFWNHLKNTYRLVIMNEESFEEVGSYRLTLLNMYIRLSAILVLVIILVVCTIVFTPIKHYVPGLPGYGELNTRNQLNTLTKEVDSLEQILQANNLYVENLRKVLIGDIDTNYQFTEPVVSSSDSLFDTKPIKEDYELRAEVERNNNRWGEGQSIKQPVSTYVPKPNKEALILIAPINGDVSDGFLPEKDHYGIDILAPANTPIKSVASGVVITADWTFETGNTIAVQHEDNLISFYKHNSVLLKKVGSFVEAGEAIAIIGNTGELSEGQHLHFELWYEGKPVDPKDFINF